MLDPQFRQFSHQHVNSMETCLSTFRIMHKKKYFTRPKKNYTVDAIPLVEAVRSEMSSLPAKTPVSVLQELLSRRGTTPKYELVQIEGAIHEPTFRYRVTVTDVVGKKLFCAFSDHARSILSQCFQSITLSGRKFQELRFVLALGIGRSKKEAKHAAAKNILEKLVGNAVDDEGNLTTSATSDSSTHATSSYDKISGNPIGTLQEMCISRRWPPPTYEMACEEGLPHERQFTIACLVFKYREVGSGKSKKLAKRQAAYKMWERLQECPIETPQITYNDDMEGGISLSASRYADIKSSKISTLTTPHSHKVSTFHKALKQSTGAKLNELQSMCLNQIDIKYVEILQEIASEQQFEVTYVDIEEKSLSGMGQCLVQLSTLPVAVCYGSGSTSKEAQASAAHNALEYLKIMTKK